MKSRINKIIAIIFTLIICCISISYAATWYVRKDGTGETSEISTATNLAQDGDTILVGPGVYLRLGYGGYWITKPLHIISENGPTVTTIRNTYTIPVSGHSEGTMAFHVENLNGSFTIKGFTIKDTVWDEWQTQFGYAIYIFNSNGIISNNIFTNNCCIVLYIRGNSNVVIENNLIYSNDGDILLRDASLPIIRFNTIANSNIYIYGSYCQAIIQNNIIVSNGSFGVYSQITTEDILFECNNVWNNTPANYGGIITDQTGTNGNISLNPLFCGMPGSGNFYLQSDSPCAESNVPEHCNGVRMGALPVNCSVGVEKESWGKIKSLYKNGKSK